MQNKSINTILKEVRMFSSLQEDELKALENISHISEYEEGATLYLQVPLFSLLVPYLR